MAVTDRHHTVIKGAAAWFLRAVRTPSPLLNRYNLKPRASRRLSVQTVVMLALLVATISGAVIYTERMSGTNLVQVVAPILALEALVIGLIQWRAVRLEASLERYFDRLELGNKRRLEYFHALTELNASDNNSGASAARLDELFVYYMFTEVDTLEYAVRKNRLGYMDRELAERAMRTFHNRCERHPLFWVAARIVVPGAGYDQEFEELVVEILDATRDHPLSKAGGLEAARDHYFETGRLPRVPPTTAAGADASSQVLPAAG